VEDEESGVGTVGVENQGPISAGHPTVSEDIQLSTATEHVQMPPIPERAYYVRRQSNGSSVYVRKGLEGRGQG